MLIMYDMSGISICIKLSGIYLRIIGLKAERVRGSVQKMVSSFTLEVRIFASLRTSDERSSAYEKAQLTNMKNDN